MKLNFMLNHKPGELVVTQVQNGDSVYTTVELDVAAINGIINSSIDVEGEMDLPPKGSKGKGRGNGKKSAAPETGNVVAGEEGSDEPVTTGKVHKFATHASEPPAAGTGEGDELLT